MMNHKQEISGIPFDSTHRIADSALKLWVYQLDNGWKPSKSYEDFDLYDTDRGLFLLSFDDQATRDRYHELYGELSQEPDEVQFPDAKRSSFEYRGKYFLQIVAENPLTEQSDDALYRGVVVDPVKYKAHPSDYPQLVGNARNDVHGTLEAANG
jgi:hypothetical protein